MIATTKNARQVGRVHYSSYGEPMVYPVADLDMNGVVDVNDVWEWDLLYTEQVVAAAYQSADLDFDGEPGTSDGDLFNESHTANNGLSGKGRLSSLSVGNRLGYAGYHHDPVTRLYDVRHRWYFPEIGRWGRRNEIGYADGVALYQYVLGMPVSLLDSLGLCSESTDLPSWIDNCGTVRKEHITDEVTSQYDRAIKACKDAGLADKVSIKVKYHKSKTDTSDDGTIRISPTLKDAPATDDVPNRLRHELEHVYQRCRYKKSIADWTCDDRLAREIQAYRAGGQCGGAKDPLSICCVRACDSVLTDAPKCFGSDRDDNMPDKRGKPSAKLQCMSRCLAIAPSVQDGEYKPQ